MRKIYSVLEDNNLANKYILTMSSLFIGLGLILVGSALSISSSASLKPQVSATSLPIGDSTLDSAVPTTLAQLAGTWQVNNETAVLSPDGSFQYAGVTYYASISDDGYVWLGFTPGALDFRSNKMTNGLRISASYFFINLEAFKIA